MAKESLQIREAGRFDLESIRLLLLDVFANEGKAVSQLALSLMQDESAQPVLALVAESGGQILGNIVFSAVKIEGAAQVSGCILAPLAVAKEHQRLGMGRKLMESGLDVLRKQGIDAVFVLGDPGYYSRYGFCAKHGVHPPYELSHPEAWMALSLSGIRLESVRGRMVCASALLSPEHW